MKRRPRRHLVRLGSLALALVLAFSVGCSATYAESKGEVDSILGFDRDGFEPREFEVRSRVRRVPRVARVFRSIGGSVLLWLLLELGGAEPELDGDDSERDSKRGRTGSDLPGVPNPDAILRRSLEREASLAGTLLERRVTVFLHASFVLERARNSALHQVTAIEILRDTVESLEGDFTAIPVVERDTQAQRQDYRALRTLEAYQNDRSPRPLDSAQSNLFADAITRLSRRPRVGGGSATGGRLVIRSLVEALRNETDPEWRRRLEVAVRDAIVVQTFEDFRTNALLNSSSTVQQAAMRTIRALGGPAIVPRILSWMSDERGRLRALNPGVRSALVMLCRGCPGALGRSKFRDGPSAVDVLQQISLLDPEKDLQMFARDALSRVLGRRVDLSDGWVHDIVLDPVDPVEADADTGSGTRSVEEG